MPKRLSALAIMIMASALFSQEGPLRETDASHLKVLRRVEPVYPAVARHFRIAGNVTLEAYVSKDGAVRRLRTISGHPLLVYAAHEAVEQWLFVPASLNGKPVEVVTVVDLWVGPVKASRPRDYRVINARLRMPGLSYPPEQTRREETLVHAS